MYKVERQNKIVQYLKSQGSAEVSQLSKLLGVSPVTIRKDLSELEKMGILFRTHGGATQVNIDQDSDESIELYVGHSIKYERSKEIIGEIAASFIEDNEWVFLGSGTTNYYIARALLNRSNLNILTNNLLVALELTKNPNVNLIMTGGNLSHTTYNLGGEIFGAYIRDISISKAFVGIAGIDLAHGYMVTTAGEFNVFNLVRSISDSMFIVADESKFNRKQFIRCAELSFQHSLITNTIPSREYIDLYQAHNINVYSPETYKYYDSL